MTKEFTWNKITKVCEFNAKIYIATQEHGRGNYSRSNHVAARMHVHAGVCVSQLIDEYHHHSRENAGKESK